MRQVITSIVMAIFFLCSSSVLADEPALVLEDRSPEFDVDTRLPLGPMILTSFSLCLVAVGAGFGWQADQEYDTWKEIKDAGATGEDQIPAVQAEMDKVADDVKTHSVAANVLMFGGAALAVTGIVWWIVAAGKDAPPGGGGNAGVAWHPAVGPGSASLTVDF